MACALTDSTPISSCIRVNAACSSSPITLPPEVSWQSSWDSRSVPIIGCHGRGSGVPAWPTSTLITTSGGAPDGGCEPASTAALRAPVTVTSGMLATAYQYLVPTAPVVSR